MWSLFKYYHLNTSKNSMWGRNYAGLPIQADHRVHDIAMKSIDGEFGGKKTISVLDIATGTGALARRIIDTYPDWTVEVNDFHREAGTLSLKKYRNDLNSPFAKKFGRNGYDLVIAIEIIEHLENPWLFLSDVRKVLRKNGLLILSMPNIDSTLDRYIYLKAGHPYYFGKHGYVFSNGHITPIPDWLFRMICGKVGFSEVELDDSIDTTPLVNILTKLKMLFFMPFYYFYMENRNDRSINIYKCR
ncbi:MAG: class I SAM-dependent methyltransferase [Spirochaetales bacterium]|nr:class I SAM-dependent methyltransferase [Spirochaetales bacterium]